MSLLYDSDEGELIACDPQIVRDDEYEDVDFVTRAQSPLVDGDNGGVNDDVNDEESDGEPVNVNVVEIDEHAPQLPVLKENLQKAYANFIESSGQFSVGLQKFAYVKTIEDIFALPRDTLPCYRQTCITVLQPDCTGGTHFGDMRVHDTNGRSKLLAIMFLIHAFCNPSIGSTPEARTFDHTPTASYTFTVSNGEITRTFFKVYTSIEPLFHRVTDSYDEPLTLEAIFESKNVRGYRIWFTFADPNISPTQAIFTLIRTQLAEMGEGMTYLTPTPEMFQGAAIDQAQRELEATAGFYELPEHVRNDRVASRADRILERRVAEVNRRSKNSNMQRRVSRQDFSKTIKASIPAQRLRYEIRSPTDFFDMIICNENHCLSPTCKEILCEYCSELPPIEDYYTSLSASAREMNPLYTQYKKLRKQSQVYADLNAAMSNDATMPVYDLIDPNWHFSLKNVHTLRRCAQPGIEVIAAQLQEENYKYLDDDGRWRFTTPFPYVFNYNPEYMLHREFTNMKLPWDIDYADFYLKLLETHVRERKLEYQRAMNSRLLSSIPDYETNPVLSETSNFHQRWKSVLPSSDAPMGEEYDARNDLTKESMMPDRRRQEEEDSRVVKIVDDFVEPRERNHRNIMRLQAISQYLCKEDIDELLRVVRAEGMRMFKSTFTSTSKTTPVVHHAAIQLDKLRRSRETPFYEIQPITTNIPGPFANYVIRMFAHAESRGNLHSHEHFFMFRQYAMNTTRCHHTDALYGQTTLIVHVIMFGYAGAGKSYLIHEVGLHTSPHCLNMVSSASACAQNTPESQDDRVFVHDEFRAGIDPTQPNPSAADIQSTSNMKEQMTSFQLFRYVTELGEGNVGASSVKDRKTRVIETPAHYSLWLLGNNMRIINDKETSYLSRFRMYIILSKKVRYGSPDLAAQGIRYGAGRINTIITSNNADFTRWCQREFDLVVAVNCAIKTGALPPPCLDMIAVHWSNVYPSLRAKYPSISKNNRAVERIGADGYSLTICHALHLLFNTVWSPIHNVDKASRTITDLPYSHDLLNLIQPLLFCPEEVAIYAITYGIFTEMFPYLVWHAAYQIAKIFGGSETAKPKFVQTPDMTTHQHMENRNMLDCGEVSQIVAWMQSDFGHNAFTAIATITALRLMTMVVDWSTPGCPHLPTEKREIHVARTVDSPNKNTINEEMRLLESTLYISTAFIKEAAPNNLIEFIMHAICHRNIRRREVLIGCVFPHFPFLPQNYLVEPKGTHTIDLSQMQTSRKYIETALIGENSVTIDAIQRRKMVKRHAIGRLTFNDGEDIESVLARDWISHNAYLGPGVSVEKYLPVNIERDLHNAHVLLGIQGTCMYPDDPRNEYKSVNPSQIQTDPFVPEQPVIPSLTPPHQTPVDSPAGALISAEIDINNYINKRPIMPAQNINLEPYLRKRPMVEQQQQQVGRPSGELRPIRPRLQQQ